MKQLVCELYTNDNYIFLLIYYVINILKNLTCLFHSFLNYLFRNFLYKLFIRNPSKVYSKVYSSVN